MRFLVVGINFHPELTGIGKYTGEMAAYLAAIGHEVRVVAGPPYYPWWQVQPPYRWWRYCRETWRGVEVWRSPLWVPRRVSGFKRVLHLASFALFSAPLVLAQVFWKPDVVMVVAPALSAAPIAWLVARLSGAKAWLHIQDFEVDAALELGILPGSMAGWLRASERTLLRRFDVVSSISGRMCERLHLKGVEPERIVFFPNWVDTRAIHPLNHVSPLRKEWGIPEDTVVVLYSGNMGEKQGLEILVEAASRLQAEPNLLFVLCGEGAARERLQTQAKGLRNVIFKPLQPAERLNDLLNLADIHVLPQRADAADLVMPSKLTGMLASGRAVVATAEPDTEVGRVVGQVGILVPPGDVEGLVQAIRDLAHDPRRRAALGARGRRYAEHHLDKQQVLDRIHDTLVKLRGKR
ncbi:colanic acid biosynthesis glycosyltransferase WcaI [Candidatus Parcubacteria bacterium]|nr:MAG: colanic acid biosynthesis glycosyltransferase WcaI [Candidatus Parcubacteria bacterium]